MEYARVWKTPPGVRLARFDDLADPGSRGFVLKLGEAYFHGFVVRRDDALFGYIDHCPHSRVPLSREEDGYLVPDGSLIGCNWHGALFRIDDGACVGGPCSGTALLGWPVEVGDDGWIVTA